MGSLMQLCLFIVIFFTCRAYGVCLSFYLNLHMSVLSCLIGVQLVVDSLCITFVVLSTLVCISLLLKLLFLTYGLAIPCFRFTSNFKFSHFSILTGYLLFGFHATLCIYFCDESLSTSSQH